MNYNNKIIQTSPEWWALKVGKISGTRFGQLISTRENSLLFELANEKMNGYIEQDDFVTDAMQFGIDNEPIAIDKYEIESGFIFDRGGVINSDFSSIHMASPDGIDVANGIVVEVKCTANGAKQLQRFRNGIEADKWGQIINYFAISDSINEVHWVSYCPFRPERELVVYKINRETIVKEATTRTKQQTVRDLVEFGREQLKLIETELDELIINFKNK